MAHKGIKNNNRAELKRYLRYGDIGKIAKAAGVDRHTVTRWLNNEVDQSHVGEFVRARVRLNKQTIKQQMGS